MGPAEEGGGVDPEGEDHFVTQNPCRPEEPPEAKQRSKASHPSPCLIFRRQSLFNVGQCQRRKFLEIPETGALQKGKDIKEISHIYKLNPFLQDCTLKDGGRLNHLATLKEGKHPTMITKDLIGTRLIIEAIHKKIGHSGRNHVLSSLHQRYWALNAHSAIRRVLSCGVLTFLWRCGSTADVRLAERQATIYKNWSGLLWSL